MNLAFSRRLLFLVGLTLGLAALASPSLAQK
jgi:hypothetical protein